MSKHKKAAPQQRQEMSGVERLGLRVSSMINHPIAQTQRKRSMNPTFKALS